MPDYKLMYHTLFNAITDAIEELQKIQLLTEELYINGDEPILHGFGEKKSEKEK